MNHESAFSAEQRRLADLRRYGVLDTPPEPQFDDLTALASQFCQTPVAAITFVDARRLWFKSGLGIDVQELCRDDTFCSVAIQTPDQMTIIPDTLVDERFAASPLAKGPSAFRFYAGMPLTTAAGHALGMLCVFDYAPRELTPAQANALQALGRQVVDQLELRLSVAENARMRVEAQNAARRSHHAATHDALTGLPNRLLFGEAVTRCIEDARREPSHHYAVMFLDLDRFKLVNDSLGHAAGDLLLHSVARRITDSIRRSTKNGPHMVARFGGDAFMVLLEQVENREAVETIAANLLADIGRPFHFGGNVIHPNISIGIALDEMKYDRPEGLLRDAESALYAAKNAGRGKSAIFDIRMHEAATARLQLEDDLRNALASGELFLQYQPVVTLDTRELQGFEALVRWKRDGRVVNPAEFIPMAEETGLIIPLGRWVLGEAIRQAAAWRDKYPRRVPPRMAVNVSRRQLHDSELVADVKRLLEQYHFDPSKLMLEITESVVMSDAEDATRVLAELRALGVRLAMDDFGTGYSSLGCLHLLDIDVLKVDRVFIANLGRRRESTVLHAVIELAHGLGMTVVAEGIETLEQAGFLRAAGCDYAQGYLYAHPLDTADAEAMLSRPLIMACTA